MEQIMKLGLIQMSMVDEKKSNVNKTLGMIDDAAGRGAQIVCLPELFNSPYFPQEEKFDTKNIAEIIPGPTADALSNSAKENKIVLVGGSIAEISDGKMFNTSVIFDSNGKIIGKYRKMHIPQDPGFYEQNYFEKGDLGYNVTDSGAAKIGTMICYDQWFPEAARTNALMGADLIFYPTAIGNIDDVQQTEGNWQEAWENVQRGHAIANGTIVSAVNRVGKEKKTTFFGGSFVIDQFGKTLVRGSDKEEVIVVECDIGLGKHVKEGWGFFYNRRPDSYHKIVE